VFATMVAVAVVVLVIAMGWRLSAYLNEAANGLLTRDILLLLVTYRLPGFLELILPISFFLAVVLVYGRFYADSEMVVLQACGLGTGRLIGITLLLGFVVTLATAFISLYLKPAGEAKVERLFAGQQNLTEFDTLVPGRFQNLSTGRRVTYTENLSEDGELSNVFMNEYRARIAGPKEVITIVADRGRSSVDPNGDRFLVLNNGARYSGRPGDDDYRVVTYDEYGQLITREKSRFQYRRRTAVPTDALLDDPTPENISEMHWRIGIILMVPIISLMAIPLSRVNPRQGRFTRLVPGMICCFLYVVILSSGRAALEKGQVPLSYGLWWVHGAFLVLVLFLFQLETVSKPFNRIAAWWYRREAS
ncbi:MAG: LPS export ABC transporter permease LptF, partial [Pseudomonadales bacterium]|nr:LPS export ABC transporter permease LptF [Pseudomonadales bacterium]